MLKKNILLLFLSFLIITNARGQEMWGISNSNFSGNMGIFLNPSEIVGAPYQYEINLAAMDLFAENTNIYFFQSDKMIFHSITGYARDRRNFFTRVPRLNNSFGHACIIGPSYIRNKNTIAWGIHSALRSEVSTLKMSPELALILTDKFLSPILFTDTFSTPAFTSAYASWIEIGGTYGTVFHETEHHIFKWAITGNLLIGMNGFYLDNKNLSFTQVNSSQLIINNIDQTQTQSINNNGGSIFGFRGMGLSTTIGFTYINHPNRGAFDCTMANDKQKKYKYRLGVSLLDLGTIYF